MKFGELPISEAQGAILAHAMLAGDKRFRKAHRLSQEDIDLLRDAGVQTVIAARLDEGDLGEDAAAARIAKNLGGPGFKAREAATGRVNFHADSGGLFTVDAAAVDAINRVDPSITLATLAPFKSVAQGQMVATVKIIPFAVSKALVNEVTAIARGREVFAVRAFTPRRVGLIQTVLPSLKRSVLEKTARLTATRLERSQSHIMRELRPAHEEEALTRAIAALQAECDMVIVFGASAVCDENDVIPAAIRGAGGKVERVGMPVDPGNLLVLGEVEGKPVIGAPGCARSFKENGFDWVLDRLMAGLPVTSETIGAMGVGGLLAEIPSRPQPRETARRENPGTVWGVLLAAGRSRRMGSGNKLLAAFSGEPLVHRTARALVESRLEGTVAVIGHEAPRVRAALEGLDLKTVENHAYGEGLSTSLRTGIDALPADAAGALIMLADMPDISRNDIDRMIGTFHETGGNCVIRATHNGKRGNPVLLPRALFAEIAHLQGDTGARHVVEQGLVEVIDLEIGAAAHRDVDTPEALAEAGGVLDQ